MEKNLSKPTSGNEQFDRTILTGIFHDRQSAEKTYQTLRDRGYTEDEIDVIMSKHTRERYFNDDEYPETELGNKAMEGAGKGSAIGGTAGAIAGAIAAVGTSLVIPGLGLVVAGPLAAGLAGAGAGGLTGGIIGALIGSGIPEERAKRYESGIKNGKILIGVKPKSEEDARYLENEWRKNRAEEVYL